MKRGHLTASEGKALAHLWPAFWEPLSAAAPTRIAELRDVEHRLTGM